MRVALCASLEEIDPAAWDRLTGDDDPFVEHAFLHALEASQSVGIEAGWVPMHVTVWEGESLVGALPLYLKTHSYGEYIFDWAWADAASRIGIQYYPKLVSMVPVTPATGKRFLVAPDADETEVVSHLLQGCFDAQDESGASSIHLLFLNAHEHSLVDSDERWLRRLSYQFHWQNRGYENFDEFVGGFRSSMRKKLNRERRVACNSGYEIRLRTGDELSADEWSHLFTLYDRTCAKKGSHPYLTREFFEQGPLALGKRAVVAEAIFDGRCVAASLNWEKGANLYGRYWGSVGEHDMLHFELCYYRLLERAIDNGMSRFEAGAQGTHKLRRGLLPAPIYSAHSIADPLLRHAIADFLPREAIAIQRQMLELKDHGPFRRDGA